jgi:hypothetical protein
VQFAAVKSPGAYWFVTDTDRATPSAGAWPRPLQSAGTHSQRTHNALTTHSQRSNAALLSVCVRLRIVGAVIRHRRRGVGQLGPNSAGLPPPCALLPSAKPITTYYCTSHHVPSLVLDPLLNIYHKVPPPVCSHNRPEYCYCICGPAINIVLRPNKVLCESKYSMSSPTSMPPPVASGVPRSILRPQSKFRAYASVDNGATNRTATDSR